MLMLLHIKGIHFRYNSRPKSEKSAMKKWVEEENKGLGKEISTNLSQNSPIIWRKTFTNMSLTNTNASTHHKDSFEVPFMPKIADGAQIWASKKSKFRQVCSNLRSSRPDISSILPKIIDFWAVLDTGKLSQMLPIDPMEDLWPKSEKSAEKISKNKPEKFSKFQNQDFKKTWV